MGKTGKYTPPRYPNTRTAAANLKWASDKLEPITDAKEVRAELLSITQDLGPLEDQVRVYNGEPVNQETFSGKREMLGRLKLRLQGLQTEYSAIAARGFPR
jgi:hypothetical protein